jgi:PPP family 3-phenylpropionic acid transporter
MRLSSPLSQRVGLRGAFLLGSVFYATGFLLWGLIESPRIVSFLTVFEGLGFALLFTTTVVAIGRMVPPSLYSTGQSVSMMVGFGLGPIIGAGIGGFVYDSFGPVVLYSAASALALSGGLVAWVALNERNLRKHDVAEAREPGAPPLGDAALAPTEP